MTTEPAPEQQAADILANRIVAIANSLRSIADGIGTYAERVRHLPPGQRYASTASHVVNNIVWGVANANIGSLTDWAYQADVARTDAYSADTVLRLAEAATARDEARDQLADARDELSGHDLYLTQLDAQHAAELAQLRAQVAAAQAARDALVGPDLTSETPNDYDGSTPR